MAATDGFSFRRKHAIPPLSFSKERRVFCSSFRGISPISTFSFGEDRRLAPRLSLFSTVVDGMNDLEILLSIVLFFNFSSYSNVANCISSSIIFKLQKVDSLSVYQTYSLPFNSNLNCSVSSSIVSNL